MVVGLSGPLVVDGDAALAEKLAYGLGREVGLGGIGGAVIVR